MSLYLSLYVLTLNSKFRWYNLNSTKAEPEFVSDTYLGMLLAQLRDEGYNVFVVRGEISQCDADFILDTLTDDQLPFRHGRRGSSPSKSSGVIDEESELQKALALSLGQNERGEDALLQAAIAESLKQDDSQSHPSSSSIKNQAEQQTTSTNNLSHEELRKKRLQKYAPY